MATDEEDKASRRHAAMMAVRTLIAGSHEIPAFQGGTDSARATKKPARMSTGVSPLGLSAGCNTPASATSGDGPIGGITEQAAAQQVLADLGKQLGTGDGKPSALLPQASFSTAHRDSKQMYDSQVELISVSTPSRSGAGPLAPSIHATLNNIA